ncbi:uncharacterized protein [Hetaerina americana]|uniref:uncharacterized protein isoform X2 n=1 Tax=Hetaerina americana TaxID=62018 RepID=UPI003A7F36EC
MVQVTVDDGSEGAAPLEEVPLEEVPLGSGGCGAKETAAWSAAERESSAEARHALGSESAGEASTTHAREAIGRAAGVERRDHSDEERPSAAVALARNGIPFAEGEGSSPQIGESERCPATLEPQLRSAGIFVTKPKDNVSKQYSQGSETSESPVRIEAPSSSRGKVAMLPEEPSLGEERQATFQKSVHLETCHSSYEYSSTTLTPNLSEKDNSHEAIKIGNLGVTVVSQDIEGRRKESNMIQKANNQIILTKKEEKKDNCMHSLQKAMVEDELSEKTNRMISTSKGAEEKLDVNKSAPSMLFKNANEPSSDEEKSVMANKKLKKPKNLTLESISSMSSLDEKVLGEPSHPDSPKQSASSTPKPNSALKPKEVVSSCEVSTGKLSPPDSPKQILVKSTSTTPKPNSALKPKEVVSLIEVSTEKQSPPDSPKQILGKIASTTPKPHSALKPKEVVSLCEVTTEKQSPPDSPKQILGKIASTTPKPNSALKKEVADSSCEVSTEKQSPPDSPKQILGKIAPTTPKPNSALKTKEIDSSCEVSTPGDTQKEKVKPLSLALQGTMAETLMVVKGPGKPSPPDSPKQILGKITATPKPNSALGKEVVDSSYVVSPGKPSPPDSPKQILGKGTSSTPKPNSVLKTEVADSSCEVSTPGETQKEKPKPLSVAPEGIMIESSLAKKMPGKLSTPYSPKQILEKSTSTAFTFISTSKDGAADSSCAASTPEISRKEKPKPLSLVPQSIMTESSSEVKIPVKPSTPDSPKQILGKTSSTTPTSSSAWKNTESSFASTAEESQGKQEKHLKLAPQITATGLAGKVSEQPSTPDSPKQISGKNASTTPTPNSAAKDRVADSPGAASVPEESRKKQEKHPTIAQQSTAAEESLVGVVTGKSSAPDSPKRIPGKSTSKTSITRSASKDTLLDLSCAASKPEDSRKEQQGPITSATQSTAAGQLLEKKVLEVSCIPDSLKQILGKNALTKSTFSEISESSVDKSVNESELKKWDNVESVYSYSDPLRRNSVKVVTKREYKHFEISLATTSPESDGQTHGPEAVKLKTPRDKPKAGVRKKTGEVGMKTKSKVSVDTKLRIKSGELTSKKKPKSVLTGSPGEAEETKAVSSPDGGRPRTGGDAVDGLQADGSPRSTSSGCSAQPSDSSSSESEGDDSDDPEALAVQEAISRASIPGTSAAPATSLPRFRDYNVQDFLFLKVLGKGSFGKVFLAALRGTDRHYAVKCLKKQSVIDEEDVECTLIERKVLSLATPHPYLCHLFCTFQTEGP